MRFVKQLALLAGVFVLSGCDDLVTGGPLIRQGEPTGIIEVANGSSRTLDVVLISACGGSTHGLNRLPSGTVIPPGRSYRWTVSAGCWDVGAGVVGYGDAFQRMNVRPGSGVRYTVR